MARSELTSATHTHTHSDAQSQILFSFPSDSIFFVNGGLFLESTISKSFLCLVSPRKPSGSLVSVSSSNGSRYRGVVGGVGFLSVSLKSNAIVRERKDCLVQNGDEGSEEALVVERKKHKVEIRRGGAMNTTKHLWAGAIAAMVSRFFCILLYLKNWPFVLHLPLKEN